MTDPFWHEQAACRDQTALFFPESCWPWSADQAKQVCRACPVLDACRQFITAHPQEHGIWAGTTPAERERQRRSLARRRQRRTSAA